MIFKSYLLVAVCACIVFVSLSANAAFTYDIAAFTQVFFYSFFAHWRRWYSSRRGSTCCAMQSNLWDCYYWVNCKCPREEKS